jgi:hypothetical protein
LKTKLNELKKGLLHDHIEFDFELAENIHDRWIVTDTGWKIILGRGLDIFQKPDDKFTLGSWIKPNESARQRRLHMSGQNRNHDEDCDHIDKRKSQVKEDAPVHETGHAARP